MRVQRILEEAPPVSQLDRLAPVHDRDPGGDVTHETQLREHVVLSSGLDTLRDLRCGFLSSGM
jgi:hypothetical protein